jgi:hypothetical protein
MPLSNLSFYAGRNAFEKIRSGGLAPDDVQIVAGAAGGPKWLVLGHLDRTVFSTWFKDRDKPLFLVGSSSGAWRFAMVTQEDIVSAVNRFETAYIHQYYSKNPSPVDIQREASRIISEVMPDQGPAQILSHPFLRLNIMAVRCKGPVARENKYMQMAGMIGAIGFNMIHRRGLKFFFDRALFYDPRDLPPFFKMDGFPLHRVKLSVANLRQAMMASGAIPILMPGITDIPGAPAGTYRDGGTVDYHMDLPYPSKGGIVLMLHYTNHIIPGWLDKTLFWRRPSVRNMANVLLVGPSPSFLSSLPHGKIPDRNDFKLFLGRDKERVTYWQTVADAGQHLSDEFMEAVLSGRIRRLVQPMPR